MGEYIDDNGKKVVTEVVLGKGGEGTVYDVKGRPKFVAKIFHPEHRTAERAAKIELMVRRPPADPTTKIGHTSITWPTTALRENGQFVGFLMPKIVNPINVLTAYHPQERDQKFENFHWGHSTRTAVNLCRAVAAIHQLSYVIGDINESNVLVTDTALVTLVDTDSFQVTDPLKKKVYHTTVGKGEYLPPELHGVPLDMVTRADTQDRFGLAIIIFKLLMEGTHPFNSLPDPADPSGHLVYELNIIRGIFPYAPSSPRQPSPAAPPFNIIHPQLQALFQQCFVEGHSRPERRPTAAEWAAALETAEADLKVCRKNRKSHRYASHLDNCPWCAREEARARVAAQSPSISTQKPMSSSGLRKPGQAPPPQTPPSGGAPGGGGSLPPEARGPSLGGFLMTWLWALFNGQWLLGLVALVAWIGTLHYFSDRLMGIRFDFLSFLDVEPRAPLALLALLAVYFLLFGRRAAWKSKQWSSAAAFKSAQRGWAAFGLMLWIGFFGLSYLMGLSPVGLVAGAFGTSGLSADAVETVLMVGAEEEPTTGDEAVEADQPASSSDESGAEGEEATAPDPQETRPQVRVQLNAANVRAGPGEAYAVVGQVVRDTLLPVIATDAGRGWYNVELPDGGRGWIGSSIVEAVDSSGTALDDVPVAATIPAP